MPLHSSEIKMFETFAKHAQENPSKPLSEMTIEELRGGFEGLSGFLGPKADVSFLDTTVPARDGHQIPIRIFNDDLPCAPVLIMYPGCGYINPLFEANSVVCSRIAKLIKAKLILVDYRLTPENPLPIPMYDGYDAAKFIVDNHGEFSIDPKQVMLGGISSGGHCAAIVTKLAETNNTFDVAHLFLLGPLTDITLGRHEFDEFTKQDLLCTREACEVTLPFLGYDSSGEIDPLFSPLHEPDVSHFPKTTIIISEYDGMRNDGEAYYKKLHEAGVQVKKIILEGCTHNTILMRGILDGIDPAEVLAKEVNKKT